MNTFDEVMSLVCAVAFFSMIVSMIFTGFDVLGILAAAVTGLGAMGFRL